MDNLVLFRVVAALHVGFARSVLSDVIEESRNRSRLVFEVQGHPRSIVVSLRPELPWVGRAAGRWEARRSRPTALGNLMRKTIRGAVLDRIERRGPDRAVWLRFADGHAIALELATHRANLVLLDRDSRVIGSARRPRSAQARLAPGATYEPPELPGRLFVPFGREAGEIDAELTRLGGAEPDPFEAIRRRMFGIGTEGAALIVAESRASGSSPGTVLVERLRALEEGRVEPIVISADDPLEAASDGVLDLQQLRLLPWKPARAIDVIQRADAAATAGLYYEAVERMALLGQRISGLRNILERELRRTASAEQEAARDRERFGDPDLHRRWGESILAGLDRARRVGDHIFVPDPYDVGGGPIAVPAHPAMSLPDVATQQFNLSRRARRGVERTAARVRGLGERRRRLEALVAEAERLGGESAIASLERKMLEERIPVGLEPDRKGRATARLSPVRMEGVRVYATTDGETILAGRSARDNHHLTFQLAAPSDFWLHALGSAGAHVILRGRGRSIEPPQTALRQAAQVAAWYSELRNEEWVAVQWTPRKNVRKPRGASPGTVVVKRFRTIRVRPGLPARQEM